MVLKAYPHHMHCYTIKNRGKLILFDQLSSILFAGYFVTDPSLIHNRESSKKHLVYQ